MSLRRTLQLALAIVVATFALALGTAAGAVDNPDYTAPPPSVLTNVGVKKPVSAPVVKTASNSSSLPITGAETMQLLVIGGVLLAGGSATMAIRRRTT